MIRRGRSAFVLAACVIAALLAACGPGAPATSSEPSSPSASAGGAGPVNLTVYAAASLKGVVEDAATAFEAANPGTAVTVSADSSTALEMQIEQGAPADVFLSADTANPQKLVDAGLALRTAAIFASNKLVIVVPKDNPGGLTTARDLDRSGLRIIAAGDEVPITTYANQVVANIASKYGPNGLVEVYHAHIVSKEDNVKAVIAKIVLGEGDAAIVYVSDAKASTNVATVAIPDDANVPATYAGVVVKASPNRDAAQAFLDWFAGPAGQAILATYGFLPPPA
jgi:molybdate transport system substrate-binding protein